MIVIKKAEHRLYLISKGETLFECQIMLGENPVGPKETEGDGKTPEGKYYICTRNSQSKFHLSLGISYPNARDAKSAYEQKRVSLKQLISITLKNRLRLRPDWDSPLGGYIMLHGESPEGKTGDWTKGCIAVKNDSIEVIYRLVKRGEKVLIEP